MDAFWKGMTHAYLEDCEGTDAMIGNALVLGLPPVLLAPLHWLEQDKPETYKQRVEPRLSHYGGTSPAKN